MSNVDINTVGLKEIQNKEFDVFKELLKIFESHDLNYFITGGTVLGTKYYGGFIPYDDDIDIAMPRSDYQKLLSIENIGLSPQYRLRHYSKDNDFKYSIIRIENTGIDIYEVSDPQKRISHPSIDIAPLDGAPNNFWCRKIFFSKLLILRLIISWYYAYTINTIKERTYLQKLVIKIMKITSHWIQFLNITDIKKKIDKELSKYNYLSSEFAGTYMGAYRDKEMIPTKYWGEGSFYTFEKIRVVGPSDLDGYITSLYGGFRELNMDEAMRARHYILAERK